MVAFRDGNSGTGRTENGAGKGVGNWRDSRQNYRFDKDALKIRIDQDRAVLCDSLGLTKDGLRYFCPFCQADGKPHQSGDFSIEGGFKCFKCDWHGDGLKLVMDAKSLGFCDALKYVAGVYNVQANEGPQPVRSNPARPRPSHNDINTLAEGLRLHLCSRDKRQYNETRRDFYENEQGQPVACVFRFDQATDQLADGQKPVKTYMPAHFKDGMWTAGDPPGKWPLFGLPRLKANNQLVVVCEGEKAASAGIELGFVATTSAHGAKSWAKTDWSPLAGREVAIIPDNDEAGRAMANEVADHLLKLSPPARVWIVELPGLPPKGDLVEFIEAHKGQDDATIRTEILRLIGAAPCVTSESVGKPAVTKPSDDCRIASLMRQKATGTVMPGNGISITEAAEWIFPRLAERKSIYKRGTDIVEVWESAEEGARITSLSPSAFQSRIEEIGPVYRLAVREGHEFLSSAICGEKEAKTLMNTKAVMALPEIKAISEHGALVRRSNGMAEMLGKGLDRESGVMVMREGSATMDVGEAIGLLDDLMADFDFVSPSDLSRAWAMILSPALRMGGWLDRECPAFTVEADKSQAGKGYLTKLVFGIYGERPCEVYLSEGGVGGLDEAFQSALLSGKRFIRLDNVRGRLNSQFIEAAMTAAGAVSCRVPYHGYVEVDASRCTIFVTSNGLEFTTDLANRSCIVRIKKREEHEFRQYPEGDALDHVMANQSRYLAAIHAIIKVWVAEGCPMTKENGHDFRVWARSLDWIIKNIVRKAPLLDGHRAAQNRVANPALTWLRLVAMCVTENRLDAHDFSASNIAEICTENGIEIPGIRPHSNADDEAKRIGILMKKCFGDSNTLEIDGFHVSREDGTRYDANSSQNRPTKKYRFTRDSAAMGSAAGQAADPAKAGEALSDATKGHPKPGAASSVERRKAEILQVVQETIAAMGFKQEQSELGLKAIEA